MLNYVMSHEELIGRTHFVEGVEYCPFGLLMSTTCVKEPAFQFYQDGVFSADAEQTFRVIRQQQMKDIYIQLHFKDATASVHYLSVLEENPYAPLENRENIIEDLLQHVTGKCLEKQIDQALDSGDKMAFYQLSSQLAHLKKH